MTPPQPRRRELGHEHRNEDALRQALEINEVDCDWGRLKRTLDSAVDEPGREFMFRVGGVRFHVIEWGEPRNPPVLLLHGRSANAISWHRLAMGLADRYRVVAFDQRGHGLSDWPGRYTDRLLVADVVSMVEAVGLSHFALVGHSMGGAIAWEYAARNSDKVDYLVLLDASPDPPGEAEADEPDPPFPSGLASPDELVEWAAAQGWTEGIDTGDVNRWLTRHVRWSPEGWSPGFDQAGYADAYASGRMWQSTRADWRDISRITCPTLVVVGGKEKGGVGQELGRLLVQRLPRGSLAFIPNTGHLVHWHDLPSTLAAVQPFLAGHPPRTLSD
jgi:pimeloyl-ACP methyl ester carboxylesterase